MTTDEYLEVIHHHLKLDKAPYHCHDGAEETVIPSEPMSIQGVLAVISRAIQTTD